jgi:hypothetical protein
MALADPADVLFDDDRIIEISIELNETDWNTLRHQTRSVFDVLMPPACMSAPFARPFTYFPATVTVDGRLLTKVGVRKKGFLGSLSEEKPALKLRFNKYVCEQHLLGKTSLTLNNALQDPAYIRQALGYRLFRDANLPAARCNFAHVTVNGDDLGLYVHVESMNKQFLCGHYVDVRGNLYEGVLSDFRPCWINTFETKTNRRTNNRADLWGMAAALAASDSSMLAEVTARVDLEQFLSFWAMEVLLKHRDGYTAFSNNFYIYHDPTSGRFQFLPWGIDRAFQLRVLAGEQRPESVFASSLLARRLYLLPQTQAGYINRLRQILNSVWDETSIIHKINHMEMLITPIADPTGSAGLKGQIAEVRQFVLARRQAITTELAAGPPTWNEALADPPCLQVVGTLSATFSTMWGTATADPFISGTGTLDVMADGNLMQIGQVGASSGIGANASGEPYCNLNIVGHLADGTFAVAIGQIRQSRFESGQVLRSDWSIVFGYLFVVDPANNSTSLIAMFGIGSVTLVSAAVQPSAPVAGAISVDLVR